VEIIVYLSRLTIATVLSAALLVPSAFASRVHRPPTSGKAKSSSKTKGSSAKTNTSTDKELGLATAKARNQSTKGHKTRKRISSRRVRGQQAIDSERAMQIQQALIREHYLSGDPSGSWDASSIAAMRKYQSDKGWQTKLMPDSRALKMLGLGPDYSSAINAKDSSFAAPPPAETIPTEQASGFAAAAGVNQ
jgi:peptidoglycan hydrolase-like protein with peptidoglycan-binding domain